MAYYKKLVGKQCYLSPLAAADAAMWAEWLNDLAVALPLGDEAYTMLPEEKMQAWVRDAVERQDHVFTIVDLATGQPIGRCLLFGLDAVNRSTMLGIFIGEKERWGQGYGRDATLLLLDYAFNLLNLHSVMLGAFAFNERAIRLYRQVGFREIGRRREARIVGGQPFDVVLMDMLEDEFRERYPESNAASLAQGGHQPGN